VVGHRGLMHSAPECTLAAFRACLALRIGFEFDVRRTKDGELVCLHDATVDRTTDGHGKLNDFSFAALRKLDAGSWFDPAFREERVPTIDEIFEVIAAQPRGDVLCAVDLKEAGDELEEKIVHLAEARGVLHRLLFIGLTIESPAVRERLKSASPKASTARLVADSNDITAALGDTNTDWIYIRQFPAEHDISRILKTPKRLFVAGPLTAGNESENWSLAAKLHIHGVLTDYPLELASQLRKVGP